MKKILILMLMLLLTTASFALQTNDIWAEFEEVKPQASDNIEQKAQNTKVNKDPFWDNNAFLNYTDHFHYDENTDSFIFMPMPKAVYKRMTKEQKAYYKKMSKLYKCMLYNEFQKAISIDEQFLPAYYNLYKNAKNNEDYKLALYYWNKVGWCCINKWEGVLNEDYIISESIILNWMNNKYSSALGSALRMRDRYYKKMGITDDYYTLTMIIADCNRGIGRYDNAIKEALKISKTYKDYAYVQEILYMSYFKSNQYNKAYEITQNVLSKGNKLIWMQRAMATASNDTLKEAYAKKMKSYYRLSDSEVWLINVTLSSIIDKKIKSACKTIQGYFKPILWEDIAIRDKNYMNIALENARFDVFYLETNSCLKKYQGNNLKACLADIKNKEEKYSNKLVADQRALEQKMAEMARLQQLQQINYNLMEQNANLNEINYQLSRPRYTNTTVTPIGNTYYMNSYSY